MTNPTPHGQVPEALRLAQELDAVPETGADPQTIQEAAAELRRQHTRIAELEARIKTMAEEHADELAVAHLDGRMRAEQPAGGLDPELGPMLDFANAGEIAFYDYAVAQHCRATLDILDGKDNGAGACNEPWASVRKRLLSIVELHQSSSAAHAGEYPAPHSDPWYGHEFKEVRRGYWQCSCGWQCGPQADGFTAPQADSQPAGADRHGLPPLPDPDLRDVGTTPGGIKEFLRGYATEYAKAALAARAPADSVLEDAARLDFLIEQRAYVVSDPDACPGYWLHFFHKETGKCWAQIDEHPTPRAAIDAARKQGANHD